MAQAQAQDRLPVEGVAGVEARRGVAKLCSGCGNRPRYISPKGRVYSRCLECRRNEHKSWREGRQAKQDAGQLDGTPGQLDALDAGDGNANGRAGDPLDASPPLDASTERTALAPLSSTPSTPATVTAAPRASDAAGVLADMLLLLDRSREAIGQGAIDALRLAIDIRGVRVHMGTESIAGRGREDETE